MSYDLSGVVEYIGPVEEKANNFRKRDLVVRVDDGQYTNFAKFEVHKDKCDELDAVAEGAPIDVTFVVRGREYNGKYFTNLVAWKWRAEQAAPADIDENEAPF